MRDIYRHAHIREMKAVAQPNQGQGHKVMAHELLEIFPRLLQSQGQYDGLLCPIAGFQEIIGLEDPLVRPVWKSFEHAGGIEVPDWRPAHYVETEWAEDGKIHGCVDLFHEAVLLGSRMDAAADCNWTDETLHEELPGKSKNNDIETDKGKVLGPFAVVCRGINKCEIERPFCRNNPMARVLWNMRVVCC